MGKRKLHKIKKLVTTVIILIFLAVLAYVAVACYNDYSGNKEQEVAKIDIPKNSSTQRIADILEDEDIIEIPILFRIVSKFTGNDGKYQFGEFELNSSMSYEQIMKALQTPTWDKSEFNLTFPEGWTLEQIAEKLEDNGVCDDDDFIKVLEKNDYGFEFLQNIKKDKLEFEKMEGYVFPDTYTFKPNEDPKSVAKKFLSNFDKKYTDSMKQRCKELGFTQDELITLASIIQAEAPDVANMKKVSSVFHNRLKKGSPYPRLESDPTIKYGRETIEDEASQEVITAYNTYQSQGLPPGAICNPGIDAINAALYPDSTDYYFFCSNLDTKEFFYAKTFDQHNVNLRKAGLR